MAVKYLLENCLQLSESSSTSGPYRYTQLSTKARATAYAVMLLSGTAAVRFVNLSDITSKYSFPSFVFFRGPRMSIATNSNEAVAMNVSR